MSAEPGLQSIEDTGSGLKRMRHPAVLALLSSPATCNIPNLIRTGFDIEGQVTVKSIRKLAKYLASNFESMNTIVFPLAGNVFQFRDLNVDGGVKMYSHMNYAKRPTNAA